MREFIVKARAAPVDPMRFGEGIGKPPHVEFLVQMLVNGLFVAKGHREDTCIHFVLESSPDFSRVLTFDGGSLGSLGGLDERAVLAAFVEALVAGVALGRDQGLISPAGVSVRACSFEQLVKEKAEVGSLFLLERRGAPASTCAAAAHPVFVLTDQAPLPRKIGKWLQRIGATPVSVGRQMLFASQCITLLHGVLDAADDDDPA